MKRLLNTIVNDTLKSPTGKWSRKSLQMFTSFVASLLIGFYIVLSHLFSEMEVSEHSIYVFFGFLSLAGYSGHLALKDKIEHRNNSKEITG